MDRETMEKVAAAYTAYSLLCPSDRVVISIDSFAEIFQMNLSVLDKGSQGIKLSAEENGIEKRITEEEAENALQKGIKSAEEVLNDKEKQEAFLQKLKAKMKSIPMVGNVLTNIPVMFRLLSSYFKGDYEDIPRNKLLIIVSALIYLISPIDLIPDIIPVAGLLDDAIVVSACIKLTKTELEKYLAWRETQVDNNLDDE